MKWIIFILALSSLALTPAEKALVDRLAEINAQQRTELTDTASKLTWTYRELESKQPLIDQVTKERDEAVNYGNAEHEKFIQAGKKLSEEKASKLKWQVAFGGFALLVGAYFGLKFLTPYGRLIP